MESTRVAWRASTLLSFPSRSAAFASRTPVHNHILAPGRAFSKSHLPTLRTTIQQSASRCRPTATTSATTTQNTFLRSVRTGRRYNSTKQNPNTKTQAPDPTPHLGSPAPAPSLSQRLKKLSREYGWSALGVYFALSALDFPICFLAVSWLGTERIGHWEHVVVQGFKDLINIPFPGLFAGSENTETMTEEVAREMEKTMAAAGQDGAASGGNGATIWTQLALAYAIHKSLIFFRVPLTAAVTPKVVKTLRGWGWDIGKRTPKPKPSPTA